MTEDLAKAMAAATISDSKNQNGTENQEPDFPNKVFLGNLAFKATEQDLKEFFAPAGNVIHTQIITQGGKSAGYGFVAYETLEQAQKAVELFHDKEYHDRKLIVEIARPKVHGQPRSGKSGRGRGRGRRGRRGGRSKSRQPREDEKNNEQAPEESQEEPVEEQETKQRSTSTRGGRRGRGRRGGRSRPRPTFTGEPSEDTLFVANLPFSFKDDDLKEIFKNFNVTSAHVVVRKSSGVSKGFGFVQLENKAEQERVLKEIGKVVVEERELSITVALSEPYKAPESTEEQASA